MLRKSEIIDFLDKINCEYLQDELLSKHTTFKIGGKTDFFVSVFDEESLSKLVAFLNDKQIPMYIFGNGSNLLVSDKGLTGVCIKYCNDNIYIDKEDKTKIICNSGASLAKLCKFALNKSLSGLEFAWGIPGTVGGALYMNAGAYDGQMKDVVVRSRHCKKDGKIESFDKDELKLAYRSSVYSCYDYVITSVEFKLKNGNESDIRAKMDELMKRRVSKQPVDLPSAGSVFKRPEGYFAGKLIQDCGLKGKQIGGARVSNKHCGFIVNEENASCEDVKNLISLIKKEVKEKEGVELQ
ncbi:MAG: UDP-N-acetylmuramate dehydrogenase, partial [Clostridia bacterium]|nr:UDP-N-acetylmuramate dehydrogenase [Clostridia bacterium]